MQGALHRELRQNNRFYRVRGNGKLEYLWLTGSNSLPDLRFLKKMKKLKTFILDMNVLDGDLTPCLDIPYVTCGRDRRHYNLKDSALPKGKIYRPEEELGLWR